MRALSEVSPSTPQVRTYSLSSCKSAGVWLVGLFLLLCGTGCLQFPMQLPLPPSLDDEPAEHADPRAGQKPEAATEATEMLGKDRISPNYAITLQTVVTSLALVCMAAVGMPAPTRRRVRALAVQVARKLRP